MVLFIRHSINLNSEYQFFFTIFISIFLGNCHFLLLIKIILIIIIIMLMLIMMVIIIHAIHITRIASMMISTI